MKCKLFEIRDAGTFIPAMAVRLETENEAEAYLARRAGFDLRQVPFPVMLLALTANQAGIIWEPHEHSSRTWKTAHEHVRDFWNELEPGSVIDVEFIRGDRDRPKESERLADDRECGDSRQRPGSRE